MLTRLRAAWSGLTTGLRSAAPEARAASTLANDVGWQIVRGASVTDYQATGTNVRALGWERHPIVNACARVIADQIGAVPLEVYRATDDGADTVVLPQHPALALLEQPRRTLTGHRLRTHLALDVLLYGNAFLLLERAGRRVRGLRRIHPARLRWADVDPATDEVVGWEWLDASGTMHRAAWEDVVHIADLSADEDAIFGFPRAAAALREIAGDGEASEFVRQTVTNTGTPALAVILDGTAGQDDAKLMEEQWHEKMAARGQRGRTKFLGGVKEIKQIGFSLKDLEFPNLRAISREGICAAFGVDPRLVSAASAKGADGGLSGTQYEEARRRLEQQTCGPLRTAITDALDAGLLSEFGFVYVRFQPDALAALVEDPTGTSARVLAEAAAGVRTVEEARRALKLDEAPDPAHHLLLPTASATLRGVAVALAEAGAEAPHGGAGADGAADGEEGAPSEGVGNDAPSGDEGTEGTEGTEDAGTADTTASTDERRTAAAPMSRVVRRGVVLTAAQRAALWAEFDTRATREESAFEAAARHLFATERAGVARTMADAAALAEHGSTHGASRSTATREAPPDIEPAGDVPDDVPLDPYISAAVQRIAADYAPGGAYHEAWLARYRALIAETIQVGADGIGGALGLAFDLENPRAVAAARRRAAALVQHVTETTRQQIAAAIEVARAGGMGMRQTAALIEELTFGEISGQRAVTIARTESVGALNEGEWLAVQDAGVMQSKEWMSQGDARVRDSHRHLDGQRVNLDQPFSNGLLYPHQEGAPAREVVRCRCTLLYFDEPAPSEAPA